MAKIEDDIVKKIQALNSHIHAEVLGIDNEKFMFWKNYCQERGFEDIQAATRALFEDVSSKEIPLLADKLSPGGFYFDYYWLFDEFPEFIQRCNWNMLNGNDWKELLCSEPKFSDKCDKWNEIDNDEWVYGQLIGDLSMYGATEELMKEFGIKDGTKLDAIIRNYIICKRLDQNFEEKYPQFIEWLKENIPKHKGPFIFWRDFAEWLESKGIYFKDGKW